MIWRSGSVLMLMFIAIASKDNFQKQSMYLLLRWCSFTAGEFWNLTEFLSTLIRSLRQNIPADEKFISEVVISALPFCGCCCRGCSWCLGLAGTPVVVCPFSESHQQGLLWLGVNREWAHCKMIMDGSMALAPPLDLALAWRSLDSTYSQCPCTWEEWQHLDFFPLMF